jgi:aspartate-semialdehyde dehydrogenase
MKMIEETKKILHNNDLKVTATTVRGPVLNSHSESMSVEFFNDFDINELKEILKNSPGIILEDNPNNNIYPLATNATGTDDVYVGRLRRDNTVDFGLNMWVVADNIRKGAASNAVQILEKLL